MGFQSKFISICLIFLSIFVLAACSKLCPPAGPRSMPPWCSTENEGTQTELNTGAPVKVIFEVSLPSTPDGVKLHINGMEYEMTSREDYLFQSGEIDCEVGEPLEYYYSTSAHQTGLIQTICPSNGKIRNGLAWTDSETYPKPGFVKAHMLMDAGNMVLDPIKDGSISSTYDSMVSDGGEIMMYLYYWAYDDYQMGTLFNEKEEDTEKYNETWESPELFTQMANGLKEKGLDLMLTTVLEWVVTPQEKEGLSSEEYFDLQNGEKWANGQEWERKMGEKLSKNPNDPEVIQYWDTWFAEYEKFALYAAEISQKNGTGFIVLGNQFWGAINHQNEQRWRNLIADVRNVYDGKIIQGIWNNEYGTYLQEITWGDALDYIMVGYYNSFVDAKDASIEELETAMEKYNTEQFDQLYARTGTPIIILTPFMSKDYGSKNQWSEPLQANSDEVANFDLQARMYEAFFNVTIDEPWFAGVVSSGYWIEDDFDPQYSFDKSGSIRNKPASLVVEKWFSQITN